jgi:RNA polymerase sigma factor (sigma-70 family)
MRLAINRYANKANHHESIECLPEMIDKMSLQRIDTAVRARTYEPLIKAALLAASASLSQQERLIVLWRYEDGFSGLEIARLLEVHPSTITRELQRIHQKLRTEVLTQLVTTHHLNASALDDCLADLQENPSYSILTAMQAG